MRRRDLLALGMIAPSVQLLMLHPALAQSKYPDRPIRLVIPAGTTPWGARGRRR
jgi:tripartite-type tricarboxylate transporter receptor subunit TctC